MNTKLKPTLLSLMFASVCAFHTTVTLAAGPQNDYKDDKSVLAATTCSGAEDCLANGYGVSLRNILFAPTYKQGHAMLAGSILSAILMPQTTENTLSINSGLSKGILSLINNTGNTADQLLQSSPEIFAPNIVLTPQPTSKPTEAEQQSALNSLSFDSIFTPTTYTNLPVGNNTSNSNNQVDQKAVANTFIQYVTGLANPMPTANFEGTVLPKDGSYSSIPQYLVDLQKNPELRDYIMTLRTYAAQLSVGISNFYYLYNERMPIQDPQVLQKALALTKQPGPQGGQANTGPLSPLQVQEILATRRVDDPKWYIAMQNAVPSTLLREMLFQLVEIPPMLLQLHLDLERVLATLSAMEIEQANNSTLLLQQKRDKANNILTNPQQKQTQNAAEAQAATNSVQNAELQQAKKALNP